MKYAIKIIKKKRKTTATTREESQRPASDIHTEMKEFDLIDDGNMWNDYEMF